MDIVEDAGTTQGREEEEAMRATVFTTMMMALASTQAGGQVQDLPVAPEVAKERWRQANYLCWNGEDLDGNVVNETAMKVACISAGVLTARLMDAGYCLDARLSKWGPC